MNAVRAWGGSITNSIGHLWSLAAEDQFYLLWPLVLVLVARGKRSATLVLVIVLAAMLVQEQRLDHGGGTIRLEFGPDTRAVGLPIGCLLAVAWTTRPRLVEGAAKWLLPVALLLATWLVLIHTPPDPALRRGAELQVLRCTTIGRGGLVISLTSGLLEPT